MTNNKNILENLLEVTLPDPDAFLKIKETLTRIGVASKKEKILYPSCHILHKQGRYYICHFKDLFALDSKPSDMTEEDIGRRNTIAKLLEQWGLCKIIPKEDFPLISMSNIKVIPFREKSEWDIRPKYSMRSEK